MISNAIRWWKSVWRQRQNRILLLQEYMTVGEQKLFLADLALRGGVWTTSHVPGDPYSSAVAEGRRQLALEIIKIANESPATLWAWLERNEKDTHDER